MKILAVLFAVVIFCFVLFFCRSNLKSIYFNDANHIYLDPAKTQDHRISPYLREYVVRIIRGPGIGQTRKVIQREGSVVRIAPSLTSIPTGSSRFILYSFPPDRDPQNYRRSEK